MSSLAISCAAEDLVTCGLTAGLQPSTSAAVSILVLQTAWVLVFCHNQSQKVVVCARGHLSALSIDRIFLEEMLVNSDQHCCDEGPSLLGYVFQNDAECVLRMAAFKQPYLNMCI